VTATAYEVYLKTGDNWVRDVRMACVEVKRPVWPHVPTAELLVIASGVGADELRMEDALSRATPGQGVLVKEAGVSGACVFYGWITGRAPSWGAEKEEVRFFAKHFGAILQERVILGAWSRGYADFLEDGTPDPVKATKFEGFRPVLDPEGRPNASIVKYEVGGTDRCRLFVPAGTAWAQTWSTREALAYLWWFAVAEAGITGLSWFDLTTLSGGDLVDTVRDFDLEGKSWWDAIGQVLDRVGWRCRLDTEGTGTSPEAHLEIWKLGSGAHRTVSLGLAGGALAQTDNAAEGNLVLDVSGTVNLPTVWGGRTQVEASWLLAPLWKTADLDKEAQPDEGEDPDEDPTAWEDTYWRRYVADPRADSFEQYRDVGRKWGLNESGAYGAAYGSPPVEDPLDVGVAGLVSVRGPRRFERCISFHPDRREYAPVKVELSVDSGVIWGLLADAEVLEDECGIRITAKDLSQVKVPENANWDNYWEAITAAEPTVSIRITASVLDDGALRPDPPLTRPAWSPLLSAVEAAYDRRTKFQRRVRVAEGVHVSQWWDEYPDADTAEDGPALTAEAGVIQAGNAVGQVRGSVVLDSPQEIRAGDVVTELAGRGISLRLDGAGGPEIYAEVVEVTLRLGDEGDVYVMEIALEDFAFRVFH
jgi:hypothetical protein